MIFVFMQKSGVDTPEAKNDVESSQNAVEQKQNTQTQDFDAPKGMVKKSVPAQNDSHAASGGEILFIFVMFGGAIYFGIYVSRKRKREKLALAKEQAIKEAILQEQIRVAETLVRDGTDAAWEGILATSEGDSVKAKQKLINASPIILERLFEDNGYTEIEERIEQFAGLCKVSGVEAAELPLKVSEQIVAALLLKNLIAGEKIPIQVPGDLPFKIGGEEAFIWAFRNAEMYVIKTKMTYEGESVGASIPVTDGGISINAGQHKMEAIQKDVWESTGTGVLVVTSHHLYFKSQGNMNTIRVPHESIFSVDVSGGLFGKRVVISRDGNNGKPEKFEVEYPVFLVKLLKYATNWR